MATVTPSSNPRTPNPPDHIKTTPSTTAHLRPWTSSTAGDTVAPEEDQIIDGLLAGVLDANEE
jgi:hypothetical protein